MEPAPEERDDLPRPARPGPPRLAPQWSPLRRSGTTEDRDTDFASFYLAAMEPAPEERDDRVPARQRQLRGRCRNGARSGGAGRPFVLRCSQCMAYLPQWSPLRRSGTTGARGTASAGCCRSRNGARSGGAGRLAAPVGHGCGAGPAAMEPAPEERDDRAGRCTARCRRGCRNGARSGGAGRHCGGLVAGQPAAAAMEPAPEERDDSASAAGALAGPGAPQWSPLRRSGTTMQAAAPAFGPFVPQWSPLRRSGTTGRHLDLDRQAAGRRNGARSGGAGRPASPQAPRPRTQRSRNGARSGGAGRLPADRGACDGGAAAMEPAPEERDDACLSQSRGPLISQPQWSPLRRSGTTIAALRSTPPGHEAAMEPAPEERDDLFTAGASGSRGLGRNGARSGGAGRPRPRVLRRGPLPAAMEPAPEERDDLRAAGRRRESYALPQWSPLRRSGTTARKKRAC